MNPVKFGGGDGDGGGELNSEHKQGEQQAEGGRSRLPPEQGWIPEPNPASADAEPAEPPRRPTAGVRSFAGSFMFT